MVRAVTALVALLGAAELFRASGRAIVDDSRGVALLLVIAGYAVAAAGMLALAYRRR